MTDREARIATSGFIMGIDAVCDSMRELQKGGDIPANVSEFIAGFVATHEKDKEKLARRMYPLMRKANIREVDHDQD